MPPEVCVLSPWAGGRTVRDEGQTGQTPLQQQLTVQQTLCGSDVREPCDVVWLPKTSFPT